jgi:hypothetical protein
MDSEFDLEEFCNGDYMVGHHQSLGRKEGFNKACAVILEEADREQYCGTIEIDKLESIIQKLRGENG